MFKMSYADIVAKIQSKSELSEEEIHQRVADKCKALAGLISQEGAAHIVANELQIKLFEQVSGKVTINNVLAGMRNVEVVGVVQQCYELRTFRRKNFQGEEYEGRVASFIMADETGRIRVTLWNKQTEQFPEIKDGTTVLVKDASVKENNGWKELHLNDASSLILSPIGIEVDTSKIPERAAPQQSTRKTIRNLGDGDQSVEVLAFVVQSFEPRFFEVCPQCGKRARLRDEQHRCEQHGAVEPDYSYVFNAVLDDGTESIRTVFFRNQLENLSGYSRDQIKELRGNPALITEFSRAQIGKHVLVTGRTTRNEMFGRTEFVAQRVRTPEIKEEIQLLGGTVEEAVLPPEPTQPSPPSSSTSPVSSTPAEPTPSAAVAAVQTDSVHSENSHDVLPQAVAPPVQVEEVLPAESLPAESVVEEHAAEEKEEKKEESNEPNDSPLHPVGDVTTKTEVFGQGDQKHDSDISASSGEEIIEISTDETM